MQPAPSSSIRPSATVASNTVKMASSRLAIALLCFLVSALAVQAFEPQQEAGQAGRELMGSKHHYKKDHDYHNKKVYFVHKPYYKYKIYHKKYYYYVDYCFKKDFVCFDEHDSECDCHGHYKYKLYKCDH